MNEYETLTEALEATKQKGYTHNFELVDGEMQCLETRTILRPGDLRIVNHHRFEGPSSGDDMAVLYLVESREGLKGVIVDAYGPYSEPRLDTFIKQVTLDEPV